MDTLFKNVWVVTVDDDMRVLENASVRVHDGRITYVGTQPQDETAARVIDGHGRKLLMPGFVNGHTHLPMTLFRSSADDLELHTWLNTRIFPMEARLTPGSVQCGAELALCELARAGVTTINDMYTQCRALIPALQKIPLRATLSMGLFGQADNAQAQLDDAVAFHDEYDGALGGLVRIGLGPHAEYTNTEAYLRRCADEARRLGCPLHIHVSETKKEHEECRARHGVTPAQLLERTGFFDGNRAFLAHCVWLEDEDIDLLARTGAAALHNPCSNLKLASGFAPVPKMLRKGVHLALCTDGASSNNNLDLWEEMRICALMHKGYALDATVVPAEQALYMATRGGALALGYEDVGSVAEGFRADLILVDIDRPCYQPMTNLIHHIVYAGNSRDVVLTMVEGRIVCENGVVAGVDPEELRVRVQHYYDTVFRL